MEGKVMTRSRFAPGALLLVLSILSSAPATAEAQEKLGTVHFPLSCSAPAHEQFARALAMLHSFWYEEAVKTFTAVTELDSTCAMGFWGVAMSIYYPLWFPPSEPTLKKGSAAIEKAKLLGAKTQRERDYIEAIEAF